MLCWAVWTPSGKITRTRRLGATCYFSVPIILRGQVGEVAGDGEERSLMKHTGKINKEIPFFSFFSERIESSSCIMYMYNI